MDPDQIQNALNRDNVRNCHRYKDIDDQRSSNDHRDHPFCIRTHQFFRGNAQRQEKGQPLLLDFIGRKVQDDQQSAAQKNTKYRQNSDQKCALRSFRIALAEQIVIVCAQNPISACGNGCNGTPQREVIAGQPALHSGCCILLFPYGSFLRLQTFYDKEPC